MMDTVLNIGLNDAHRRRGSSTRPATSASPGTATAASCRCTATSCSTSSRSRRPRSTRSRTLIEEMKHERGVTLDTELTVEDLQELVQRVQGGDQGAQGQGLPRRPDGADVGRHRRRVRLVDQRPRHRLSPAVRHPARLGHGRQRASMVFGNMGDDCGTGVAFTRDPATGENVFYGDYLINAQGEDVVAGIRTPQEDRRARDRTCRRSTSSSMKVGKKLEKHYRDVQDIEFTIQQGKLWMLQMPQRQADRLRRRAHRRRHGRRGADHARRRRCCAAASRPTT